MLVPANKNDDIYGRLIEKKRVGVFTEYCFAFSCFLLYPRTHFFALYAICIHFLLLLLCAPYSISLLDHLNYNVNHLYVIHVVMHVFIMFRHFTQQILLKQKAKNHHL
jgi:hypothetical protein